MSNTSTLLKHIKTGEALEKAKKMGSDKIIKEVKDSELRGRGGAGFPTGMKWEFTKNAPKKEKYIVCNADEGEVGTFKDRELFKAVPDKLLEGMAIAAVAVGASNALIYLRGEYTFLKDMLQSKISKFKKFSDLSFEIRMGSGAYVCGEETALLESLEGRRGEPRNKPPYPVEEGYLASPTVINNVETLCCIPHIIIEGAKSFSSIGTKNSKGYKLFSISGDVSNPGVYEFPMGITIKEILQKAGAKTAKAVLVGGASGICVGEDEFDRKVAFEDLPPGGAIIVFNRSRKMIDILENIMDFFVEESCGQCVPCREGNYKLHELCKQLQQGKSMTDKQYEIYMELAESMNIASKCGLGQSSVNAFLSIIKNFKDEFVHIKH